MMSIDILINILALFGGIFMFLVLYFIIFDRDDFDESVFIIDHEKLRVEREAMELKCEILERNNMVLQSMLEKKDKVEYHDVLVEWIVDGQLNGKLHRDVKFVNGVAKLSQKLEKGYFTFARATIKDVELYMDVYVSLEDGGSIKMNITLY